jgi:DNA-binding LytR/AlgR family response regulator
VDDEPPALDILKKYIGLVSSLELSGVCDNAVEATNFLQENPVDLLFLDIQMPYLRGTDWIRTLKNPPRFIFTTAHRNFAVDAFDLDAEDFLLKPISFERFLKAVNKVMNTNLIVTDQSNFHSIRPTSFREAIITVRADRKNINIQLDDILFIESLRDYVKIVTKMKNIISKQSISSLESVLPNEKFVRIHRSFIVSINKIESFTNETIEINHHELPLSRMYRHEVEKILNR